MSCQGTSAFDVDLLIRDSYLSTRVTELNGLVSHRLPFKRSLKVYLHEFLSKAREERTNGIRSLRNMKINGFFFTDKQQI